MAKKNTKKESGDILENPDALAERLTGLEAYIEKNPTPFYIIVGVITVIVAGFFGGRYYLQNQNELAQNEMFQAQYYFEQDSLDLALYGDGSYLGFVDIADDFGITKAGKLAHFYAGVSFMKQGQYEDALEYLKGYKTRDLIFRARAFSLMGDAYVEMDQFEDAVTYYEKAAAYKPNEYMTPIYLNKLALVQEEIGNFQGSIEAYDEIISDYPNSAEARNAKKNKQRLEMLLSR